MKPGKDNRAREQAMPLATQILVLGWLGWSLVGLTLAMAVAFCRAEIRRVRESSHDYQRKVRQNARTVPGVCVGS